jgi:hypothetical protein
MLGLFAAAPFFDPGRRTWVGFAVFPVVLLVVAPLLARARREETTFDLSSIILVSLALGMILAYVRFRGAKDAFQYQLAGKVLAQQFLRFNFHPHIAKEIPGTGSVEYVTGLVNALTASTYFATFLVFAAAAFIARYLFYRAFVTGLPEGDHKRYALLIFLWPSLLYWPSSIGKEACMVLALGVASLGAARMLQYQRGGLTAFVVGVVAAGMVRPHIALVPLAGMLVALLFRRSEGAERDPGARLAMKIAGVVIILAIASVMARNASDLLQTSDFGNGGVSGGFAATEAKTGQGGSAFTPAPATNPVNYPLASVTVLFRPFPGEAGGIPGALSSFEGILMFVLFVTSWKRVKRLPGLLLDRPYLLYALVSIAVFIFAYSSVANFGILARQRSQVLPFVLIFLALPPVPEEEGERKTKFAKARQRMQAIGKPRRQAQLGSSGT